MEREMSIVAKGKCPKAFIDINLRKYVQDVYVENYEMSLKEIKEQNKQRDCPCSWAEILNIFKMSVLLHLI